MFLILQRRAEFILETLAEYGKYIAQDTSVVFVKSLVISRLDYSNGLFYGLPKYTVSGLQVAVTRERL